MAAPSVLRMAAPLVVSFWMRAGVTFVDTIYASFLGDAAVAAVGLTIPLEFLMLAGWVGLSTGLTSALSRAFGARQGAKVDQYLRVSWRVVWLLAPAFILIGLALWPAAGRIGLDAGVAREFRVYGSVLIAGSALTTFWSIIPDSLVKAHQDTRSTMWAGIWTNVLNFGLNSLFLFVFGWGVFGIALSTVIGRLGGLVYALRRAAEHERRRRESGGDHDPTIDPTPRATVLSLAVPSSLTFVLMATEAAIVNALLAAAPASTESIAAYSIFYRLALFGLQPVIATSVAMLPFAAHRAGANDYSAIRRGLRDANVAGAIYALGVLAPILLPGSRWIASRLTESATATDLATFAVAAVPFACLAGTPFLLCRPVIEALGRGRPGLGMAVLRYVLLTGPLVWLGVAAASALDRPRLEGAIAGTLLASAIASATFYLWLRNEIPRAGGPTGS